MTRISLGLAKTLAVIGLIFWILYVAVYISNLPSFLVDNQQLSFQGQIIFGLYGYITLLIGVFLGAVYQSLIYERDNNNRRAVNIGKVIHDAVQSVDFWIGLFASPVVYAVLLQAVDLESISAGAIFSLTLISLQNGYVCNRVADSVLNQRAGTRE